MSVKITVNGNQIDLKDMVQGGTYDTKKTIGTLSGLPTGKVPDGTPSANIWAKPNPTGITVGGVDISTYYEAYNITFTTQLSTAMTYTIPIGCTKMKIILLNGGQSGAGLNGGSQNKGESGLRGNYYVNDNIPVVNGKTTFVYLVGQGGIGTDSDKFNNGTQTIFSYNNIAYSPEDTYKSYTFPDIFPITNAGYGGMQSSYGGKKSLANSQSSFTDSYKNTFYTPPMDNAPIGNRGWSGYCGCVRVFFLFEDGVKLQSASQPVNQVIQPVTLPDVNFFTGIFA